MALQLSIDTPFGVTLPEAYVKVSAFSGNKDCMVIEVDYFATEAAREAGNPVVKHSNFQWNNSDMSMTDVTNLNTLVGACYVYLKTLPDFADATDV